MAVSLFECLAPCGVPLGSSIGVHGFAISSCEGENGFVAVLNYFVMDAVDDTNKKNPGPRVLRVPDRTRKVTVKTVQRLDHPEHDGADERERSIRSY